MEQYQNWSMKPKGQTSSRSRTTVCFLILISNFKEVVMFYNVLIGINMNKYGRYKQCNMYYCIPFFHLLSFLSYRLCSNSTSI